MASSVTPAPDVTFACGAWARWLPRALAAAVLVVALVGAYRIDPARHAVAVYVRPFVATVGAVFALLIVRQGGEVRQTVGLTRDAVVFRVGARSRRLRFADIRQLDYAAPFSSSRHWLPAAVLIDEQGAKWRVSALVDGGGRWLAELLRRSARHDLEAWAEAKGLARGLSRSRLWVVAGYALAGSIAGAGILYHLG